MIDSGIVDVAIGIILLYLLISAICSAFTEAMSRFFNLRAKFLKVGLRQMLNDADMADSLLAHPLVTGMKEPDARSLPAKAFRSLSSALGGGMGQGLPSYLASNTFRAALVDKVIGKAEDGRAFLSRTETTAAETMRALRTGLDALEDGELKDRLRTLLRDAEGGLAQTQAAIEKWFDQSMERVSGWYKRQVRWFLLGAAVLLVAVLNADTVRIGITLWQDQAVRSQVVALAGNATEEEFPPDTTELRNGLTDLKLIGWRSSDDTLSDPREVPDSFDGWLYKLGGLLITVIAVQQGANFWFDLLKKVVNLRASGGPPSPPATTAAPAAAATGGR